MLLHFIFFSFLSIFDDVHCLALAYTIEVVGEAEAAPSTIYFAPEVIKLGVDYYDIESRERTYFTDRIELINILDCLYSFDNIDLKSVGFVDKYNLSKDSLDTQPIYLVSIGNGTIVEIILNQDRWKTFSCDSEIYVAPGLSPAMRDTVEAQVLVEYIGTEYTYTPSTFETVTEQVLAREASRSIEIIPALYETVSEQVLSEETNVCKNLHTEYELLTEQVLVKAASNTFTIDSAVYETVSEQVLVRDGDLLIDVEIPINSLDTIRLTHSTEYTKYIKSWIEGCDSLSLDCIDYDFVTVPAKDTMVIINSYTCPEDYLLWKGLCTKITRIPFEYTSLTYEKLVSPTFAIHINIPAEYGTRTYGRINNKNELPDSCIVILYETREYEKLVSPSTVEVTEIPATFETRSYTKLVTAPQLESAIDSVMYDYQQEILVDDAKEVALPQLDPRFITDGLLSKINSKLTEKGYPDGDVYKSLYQLMCDHDLPIYGITSKVLELLEIDNLSIIEDSLVVDLSPTPFIVPIVRTGAGNNSINQFILTPDCQSIEHHEVVRSNSIFAYDLKINNSPVANIFIRNYGTQIKYSSLDNLTTLHTIFDITLDSCDTSFPVTHLGTDTIWLDIQRIFRDDQDRKVIEFDIEIEHCDTPPIFFQFIEGIGTNAGLNYTIENEKVQGLLLCHETDDGIVFQALENSDCEITTASTNFKEGEKSPLVYPNPSNDYISIAEEYKLIEISNTQGVIFPIFNENSYHINISQLSIGMYFVKLEDTKGVMHIRQLAVVR